MDKNSVKTLMFGRARRIKLLKQVIVGVVILLILIIAIALIVKKNNETQNANKNFNMLRNYFVRKGYTCEMIEKSGGQCNKKASNTEYIFTRYDEGFNYLVKANSYTVEIRHIVNTYNDIILTTNNEALEGDKNKKFTCTTNDGLLGELTSCVDSNGVSVVNEVYSGAVEMTIKNLNDILSSSGYKKDKLINDYIWEI